MRVSLKLTTGVWDSDETQSFDDPITRICPGDLLVRLQGLLQLPADREDGVQGRPRILRDQRDAQPTKPTHLLPVEFEEIASLERDVPTDYAPWRGEEAKE